MLRLLETVVSIVLLGGLCLMATKMHPEQVRQEVQGLEAQAAKLRTEIVKLDETVIDVKAELAGLLREYSEATVETSSPDATLYQITLQVEERYEFTLPVDKEVFKVLEIGTQIPRTAPIATAQSGIFVVDKQLVPKIGR